MEREIDRKIDLDKLEKLLDEASIYLPSSPKGFARAIVHYAGKLVIGIGLDVERARFSLREQLKDLLAGRPGGLKGSKARWGKCGK